MPERFIQSFAVLLAGLFAAERSPPKPHPEAESRHRAEEPGEALTTSQPPGPALH